MYNRQLSRNNSNQIISDNNNNDNNDGNDNDSKALTNLLSEYFGDDGSFTQETAFMPFIPESPNVDTYENDNFDKSRFHSTSSPNYSNGFNFNETDNVNHNDNNENQNRHNIELLSLPNVILHNICCNLKFKDIINIELCNKELFYIARNENSHCEFNLRYIYYLNDFRRFNKIEKLIISPTNGLRVNKAPNFVFHGLTNHKKQRLQFSFFPLIFVSRFYRLCF